MNNINFYLRFESSGDIIPFQTVLNETLINWFIEKANTSGFNKFKVDGDWVNDVTREIAILRKNLLDCQVELSNLGICFDIKEDPTLCLDQDYLNELHSEWVKSQDRMINIDDLRGSETAEVKSLGEKLHDMYPDQIRIIRLAEAMEKIGLIEQYEDINMSVHRLESLLRDPIDFSSEDRYGIFDNEKFEETEFTNDRTHFSFSYTYLGRQNHDKWINFDNGSNDDYYNFEKLEQTFNIGLCQPETRSFSPEFTEWCQENGLKPIGETIAIANIPDLQKNLFLYRRILYNNGKAGNQASLALKN